MFSIRAVLKLQVDRDPYVWEAPAQGGIALAEKLHQLIHGNGIGDLEVDGRDLQVIAERCKKLHCDLHYSLPPLRLAHLKMPILRCRPPQP